MNKDGYVFVRAPEGHPYAYNNGRYIMEHRLVMEGVLGRYLTPEEEVHHKNGIRDDNIPTNLELWTKSQPWGVRVSDMYIWCEDFIAKYKEDMGKIREINHDRGSEDNLPQ